MLEFFNHEILQYPPVLEKVVKCGLEQSLIS